MAEQIPERRKKRGHIVVTVRDLAGNIIDRQEFHNLLTTVGLNMMRDVLYGDASDAEIKYMGVGSDDTAPVIGNTTLGTETFRKQITTSTKPANGQVKHSVYIAPDEAVGTIEELGWFAGPAATASADTGIMISRRLYSRVKTNLESILVERTDSVEEA